MGKRNSKVDASRASKDNGLFVLPRASSGTPVKVAKKASHKTRVRTTRLDKNGQPKKPLPAWLQKLDDKFLYHFHWQNIKAFWFSKHGFWLVLKIIGIGLGVLVLVIVFLFIYFSKDLAQISPEGLASRVSTTVNRYYDRNGVLLWEDKGDGDYKMTVPGNEISQYMRWATVAIEDREFYSHGGVSIRGTARAVLKTLSGQSVQGGSTLTQQLVKQVYFSAEAADRTLTGVPRKVKEIILAIQVEHMYDKEDIITLYLNESPYGGRRNGVQSGARAYFGKDAINLTLAEAALLASIPQNPSRFNPYNRNFHAELLGRQNYTLQVMAELGYITSEEAEAAKVKTLEICSEDIGCRNGEGLAEGGVLKIRPSETQFTDIKAPHFVTTVKQQLEQEFCYEDVDGVWTKKAVCMGGWSITTTLDYRAQQAAEEALLAANAELAKTTADNIAMASIDVETGQVIAVIGSADWGIPDYGQLNATTQLLEPGSTIKPLVDYGPLFMERSGVNYGPGSILRDENINEQYCAHTAGRCSISNTIAFTGNIPIRQSLGSSLNRPAIKALMIGGAAHGVEINHQLGNWSYCSNGETFWSLGIGSGCAVRMVEHANAFASLARGGAYKELSYVLEATDGTGRVMKRWEDKEPNQVLDPQTAYLVTDILHDPDARRPLLGSTATSYGWSIPGVWTGSKTGTTTDQSGSRKDNWFVSFSPVLSTVSWCGKHDGDNIPGGCGNAVRRLANNYMEAVHRDVYVPDGRYQAGQGIPRPSGIKTMTIGGVTDIWPSWMTQAKSGWSETEVTWNSNNHKLATICTPNAYKVSFAVMELIDPVTEFKVLRGMPEGYSPDEEDDCDPNLPPIEPEPEPPIDPGDQPTEPENPTGPNQPVNPTGPNRPASP